MKIERNTKPLIILIAIQILWITVVVLWVAWFVNKHREFSELAEKYKPELLGNAFNWPVMVEGITMLLLILVGVYIIFVYWNRQSILYAAQRDVISQVTHELKSPLASIQLHLETIKLRKPSEERLNSFVATMLDDTERLHYLINNLLMAARLEKKNEFKKRSLIDLSELVEKFVESMRGTVPASGSLNGRIESGIKFVCDPEAITMALRNLFENAIRYSPESPEIEITLEKSNDAVELTVSDKGRGIEKRELKKIFDRFYRVSPPGENIRGTGLGLYIVSGVVRGFGGSVIAESEGIGKGAAFRIRLPARRL